MYQDELKYFTEFWKEFLLKNWEREPFAIHNNFIPLPTTPDELFSIIIDNSCNKNRVLKRFYIDGKLHQIEGSCFYPIREDASFSGYDKRIRSLIPEQEYILVIDRFEVNNSLWQWTYKFLKQIYEALGFLNYGHFYSIFYGNYSNTPFGVHDHPYPPEGAFYFPIVGQKEMKFWKPEFVKLHPSLVLSKEYDKFLENSLILEAEPGGTIYWPSDRWHIGNSQGGDIALVIAINTSNDFVRSLGTFILQEIEQLYGNSFKGRFFQKLIKVLSTFVDKLKTKCHYQEYLNPSSPMKTILKKVNNIDWSLIRSYNKTTKAFFNPKDLQESAEQIPEVIQSATVPYRGILEPSIIERASIKLWLTMLTCYGFTPSPNSKIITSDQIEQLTIDNYIQKSPEREILWRRVGEHEVLVCVQGNFINFFWHPTFKTLIKRLNTGEIYSIREVLDNFNSKMNESYNMIVSESDILIFLKSLLKIEVLKIIVR